ncbi:hypothetical protein K435DRAFT_835116 [Dendrothele bispora CBS 962.96]|uniref:BZIP domain-containing protein n=1 Tax=Dendrothele bispora (strain CBS 962.96) TaxID=1314807 RepID=A0A4S8MPJ6_DENBC|nr:hypothetical protein K435DRAFT_835116 [Dendrothele bispora CBS 962.96]
MASPPPSSLWATASKEWVIQPKPKPGRKPKKDPAASNPVEDSDGKGRRVQNRAAQRAFRERKQSQLAELQARVQSYEQGEIERNVALQSIAKRLKEENEVLRRENNLLRERIAALEQDQQSSRTNGKRWRDDSPSSVSSISASTSAPRKPSPPSMASSPDSNASSEAPFSPIPMEAHLSSSTIPNIIDLSSTTKSDSFDTHSVFRGFGCGFCTEGTPCVCREAFQAPADVVAPPLKVEAYEQPAPPALIRIGSPSPPSVLDNLPAYQPPVPLRRKTVSTSENTNSVFPAATVPQSRPTCSGDPSNCMACADDSFGKAFCAALGKSIASQSSVCPCPPDFSADPVVISLDGSTDSSQRDDETIPTDDAWRQLKSHPNVAFSDLALLADVVARRSKCTGPRVVISPAPGTVTPERVASPTAPLTDTEAVLLTDPHAHYHEKERARSSESPPRLVPQEVLVKCGQDRVREVQAAGVRDALRLLDSKFSMS